MGLQALKHKNLDWTTVRWSEYWWWRSEPWSWASVLYVFHIDQTWDIIMIIHPATRKFLLWLLCKKSSETCHSVTKYVFKIQILFIYFFEIFLITLVIWWLTFGGYIHCNAIVSKESFLKIKHVKHFRSYCSIIVHVKRKWACAEKWHVKVIPWFAKWTHKKRNGVPKNSHERSFYLIQISHSISDTHINLEKAMNTTINFCKSERPMCGPSSEKTTWRKNLDKKLWTQQWIKVKAGKTGLMCGPDSGSRVSLFPLSLLLESLVRNSSHKIFGESSKTNVFSKWRTPPGFRVKIWRKTWNYYDNKYAFNI